MQSPLSWGRKVTEAVIWRKMAAISAWISGSVFSAGAAGAAPATFSWLLDLEEDLDLDFVVWKIWTWGGGCG